VNLELEELELELANLKDKVREVKELIDELVHLWDTGSLYPDGERVVSEIRDAMDGVDV
jgi:hypothetical protein|tara:strand:+ start:166 stop:342 length:177 start_codon:yes stop_codon:yes gene_type:complete